MSTRKRNEFLDADESDDNEQQYDLEEDESRSRMLRSAKRQKTSHSSASEDEDADHSEADDNDSDDESEENLSHEDAPSEDDNHPDDDNPSSHDFKNTELARLEALAANLPVELKLQQDGKPLPLPTKPKKDRSGVIYLSRVPPFMKPAVLRSLLTPYGTVGRIFLTPESSEQRHQRLRNGGTRRKLFLDGWVEFLHKRDAKFVAETLNAQTMGGRKRSRWHDEVWNIKYLSGLKWQMLVEQIQNENAERAARLRQEISRTKKENEWFVENVEKGKMISGIQAKRKTKGQDEKAAPEEDGDAAPERRKKERKSKFEQHAMKSKVEKGLDATPQTERVLSSIF